MPGKLQNLELQCQRPVNSNTVYITNMNSVMTILSAQLCPGLKRPVGQCGTRMPPVVAVAPTALSDKQTESPCDITD